MSGETTRETLELMIEAAIRVSPIALTAGAVHRIIETSTGSKIASRSTVQRILDRMVESGAAELSLKTVEKNGHMIEKARHYSGSSAPSGESSELCSCGLSELRAERGSDPRLQAADHDPACGSGEA